jgi:hypothetical protein
MQDTNDEFYDRADAHIHLSNSQVTDEITRGKVSSSFMYSVARYNAWVSACGWPNATEMKEAKEETIEYFTTEFKKMLEENLDDYIENFETYIQPPDKNA